MYSHVNSAVFAMFAGILFAASVAFADHNTEPLPPVNISGTSMGTSAVSTHHEESSAHAEEAEHSHACHIESNLSVGSRGEEVECLQMELIGHGFLSVTATGYFGELTKAALMKWQTERGIPATGYLGPLSRAAFAAPDHDESADNYYLRLQKAHEAMMRMDHSSMSTSVNPKVVAVLLYDGFAILDAVGPIQTLGSLLDYKVITVAKQKGEITSESGTKMVADYSLAEVTDADVLVIPGGLMGTLAATKDPEILNWIKMIDTKTDYTTSVCTGSWILAATGLLSGKNASTHWSGAEYLEQLGAHYTGKRYTVDGKYVTSAGVSGGIDMALALAGMMEGETAAKTVQLVLEYDPQPPYDSGSPQKADPELVKIFTAMNDDHIKAALAMASADHDHSEPHSHAALDVSVWPSKPSVSIVAHPDALGGWNLEVKPENFRFAPEHVNGAVVPNEGHAHLYINGTKIARLYGNWYSLPATLFSGSGTHEIIVTLNANDHGELQYQGTRIEAKTTVTK